MKLVLIVLFCGIVFTDTVSACSCNGFSTYDTNYRYTVGECLSKYYGRKWCYVKHNAICSDKAYSSRSTASNPLWWSYEACASQQGKLTTQSAASQQEEYFEHCSGAGCWVMLKWISMCNSN